jgi:hypothetical protein
MKPDAFEKQLQQRPLRSIPTEWRAEILRISNLPSPETNQSRRFAAAPERSGPNSWIELFRAWRGHLTGLAIVWLLILALKATTSNTPETLIASSPSASPEIIVATQEQQHLLAELFEPASIPTAERPKPVAPRPRSDLPAGRRSSLLADEEFHQTCAT